MADITITGSITVNAGARLFSTFGGPSSNNSIVLGNPGTLTVNGELNVRDLTVNAGGTASVAVGADVILTRNLNNSGTFTNAGEIDVPGGLENTSGGVFRNLGTGRVIVNGNVNNNGSTFTNDGYVFVDGNLRNNPGGVLNGDGGTWDVDVNAINTAGGFIEGRIVFCDAVGFNNCLTANSCVTEACTTNCANANNPLNSASGTVDSTNISFCGVPAVIVLSSRVLTLNGSLVQGQAALNWEASHFVLLSSYRVERASNEKAFIALAELSPTETSFVDKQPPVGNPVYRVVGIYADGSQVASNNVVLSLNESPKLFMYPNPVSDVVNLQFAHVAAGPLHVEIVNMLGQRMQKHT